MKKCKVAVIGVGAVGIEILRLLKERAFSMSALRVFARSSRDITVDADTYHVEAIEGAQFEGIDIALFAGTEGEKGASSLYAEKFIAQGAVVVDNGADFRLKDGVPLVVPEVNRQAIVTHKGLIANPNCTTIQMVVALGGIQKQFGLEKIIVTSFQATSGAGRGAAQTLWDETSALVQKNKSNESYTMIDKEIDERSGAFSHQIAFNAIAQIGSFGDEGYTSEEWKVVKETHKIYNDSSIQISATCVRVPVFTAHSEAIYFSTKKKAALTELEDVLAKSEGVAFSKDPAQFPIPLAAEGRDEVFVGRLRRDPFAENAFWLWCVSDNLRKGAALNAVQIAECVVG